MWVRSEEHGLVQKTANGQTGASGGHDGRLQLDPPAQVVEWKRFMFSF